MTHRHKVCERGVKDRIVDMTLNGSGDTARVLSRLSVTVGPVITTIKKSLQSSKGQLEKTVIL
ncbi:IS1-like element transposase [Legionella gratiana]|uniref:IS1-like element transposase n=1 Tax=Legionella gratiana TaxID=45066 RepID=UPI001041696D